MKENQELNKLEKLYTSTFKMITSSKEEWQKFLDFSSYNYKFSFKNRVVLYAQNPNTKSITHFDTWTKTLKANIKKGEKGLAIFSNGYYCKRLFAIEQTSFAEKETKYWNLDISLEELKDEISEYFKKDIENIAVNLDPQDEYTLDNDVIAEYLTDDVSYIIGKRLGLDKDEKKMFSFLGELEPTEDREIMENYCMVVNDCSEIFLRSLESLAKQNKNKDLSFSELYDKYLKKEREVSYGYTKMARRIPNIFRHLGRKNFRLSIPNNRRGTGITDDVGRMEENVRGSSRGSERGNISGSGLLEGDGEREIRNREVWTDVSDISSKSVSSSISTSEEQQLVDGEIGEDRQGVLLEEKLDERQNDSESEEDGRVSRGYRAASEATRQIRYDDRRDSNISDVGRIRNKEINAKQLSFDLSAEPFGSAFLFSDVDTALKIAINGNEGNRKLVIADYISNRPKDEIIETLKSVYVGYYGFIGADGKEISLIFDKNEGMVIANGKSAMYNLTSQIISWNEIEDKIHNLMSNGEYATQLEIDEAYSYRKKILAEKLVDIIRDIPRPLSDEDDIGTIYVFNKVTLSGSFPDDVEVMSNNLNDEDYCKYVVDELNELDKYDRDRKFIRFSIGKYYPYSERQKLKDDIKSLGLPKTNYQSKLSERTIIPFYITDDEINDDLTKGSHFGNGKSRIYEYFKEEHTATEKADFLKNEYGTGGRYVLGFGVSHDSKGITYSKYSQGYKEELHLKWNDISKRIESLIDKEMYADKSESNFRIKQTNDKSSFVVVSDSIRYGTNAITFQGSYDECLDYIDINTTNIVPRYYVIKDLSTWSFTSAADNNRSKIEYYNRVEDAIQAFREYKKMDYLKEEVINPYNEREAVHRLTLGVSYTPHKNLEMDILHTIEDRTVLLSDVVGYDNENGYKNFMTNKFFRKDLRQIFLNIHIDDYLYYRDKTRDDIAEEHFEDVLIQNGESEITFDDAMDYADELIRRDPNYCKTHKKNEIIHINSTEPFLPFLQNEIQEINNKSHQNSISDTEPKYYKVFWGGLGGQDEEAKIVEDDIVIAKGDKVIIDEMEFIVDRVNKNLNEVSLQDVMMFERGYPIFRSEDLDRVKAIVEYQNEKSKWYVEFNESEESKGIVSLKNNELSPSILQNMVKWDSEFKEDGYLKFYLEKRLDDYVVKKLRVDIGDGLESNKEIFTYLSKELKCNLDYTTTDLTYDMSDDDYGVVEVGDIFENENRQWKCTKNDGFILSAENIDKSDSFNEISLVGMATSQFKIIEKSPKKTASSISDKKENYHDINDVDTPRGEKVRFERNYAAIETLKNLERENREPTAEEKIKLYNYVGWGGCQNAFSDNNSSFKEENRKLKELLTDKEYEKARSSVTSAFYTPKFVIDEIYTALEDMGFKGGKVIEPSMGTGKFFANMPQSIEENSKLYGVEVDDVTGRISQKLYPNAKISIKGFEETTFKDDSFDLAISNVPYGNYTLSDERYKKGMLIHDYFFEKSLDKLKPNGLLVFLTSSGTLDKNSIVVRKEIAKKAELLGAIRLPEGTFNDTKAVSDIIILQKRETLRDEAEEQPDWIYTSYLDNGVKVNNYFKQNPEMMLGEMIETTGQFGPTTTLKAHNTDISLKVQLNEAFKNIVNQNKDIVLSEETDSKEDETKYIYADDSVKNYTYTVVNDKLYYRENEYLIEQNFNKKKTKVIKDFCELREALKNHMKLQNSDIEDNSLDFKKSQENLNKAYDKFVKKNHSICDNLKHFENDVEVNLISSLEEKDGNANFVKTDIFYKRTVRPVKAIEIAETAEDALMISLNFRRRVDLDYIMELYPHTKEEILEELKGKIYLTPLHYEEGIFETWETAEEYLSGNVREKLRLAKLYVEDYPDIFTENVIALEKIQPKEVTAGEIDVRLGTTWIDTKYINEFMYKKFDTSKYYRKGSSRIDNTIKAVYNKTSGEWKITNKTCDSNQYTRDVYGTSRMNSYYILENCLNLKSVTIKDAVTDLDGKEQYVINHKETLKARERQDKLQREFKEWIFDDTERREYLVNKYNSIFNNTKLREYDGSHLIFPELNPLVADKLYDHQKNAIARIRTGENTLLAHVVGAGKTWEMAIGEMEKLRLGITNKVAFVVPNHLIDQFSKELLFCYPNAKVLKTTTKDFEKKNRQKFLSKIALSDCNMIVMSHSQFEKIKMSPKYEEENLKNRLAEYKAAITIMNEENGKSYSVKQMETQCKKISERLKKLHNVDKDQNIYFEDLGINSICVDEAHYFKNGAIFSKMTNVAGISKSDAKKAEDMLMKCQWINENNGTITFATGTPISNTMCEAYIMQRYLRNDLLKEYGIYHFDEWAACFGEATTSLELAPEGKGFRAKTRFNKFHNMPEFMTMFKSFADIKTADQLNLPTPELETGKPQIINCKPNSYLKEWMEKSLERVERIRTGQVKSYEDNMLKFTGDAKKAGLDMRLINDSIPNDPNGKISKCADLVKKHYDETQVDKGVQIIFCDTSTPNKDKWNVYDEVKAQLVELGIPSEEIEFIHNAKDDEEKDMLFEKCRNGEVRVLVGSTQKCGAGTNIQDRLIALHHLDCPYRPSDIEQREGRIIRQGNMYNKVNVYRYVTEESFDAYLWSIVANKAKFISQVMQSKTVTQRTCEEVDEAVLNYAEVQAVATGDPRIKERIELDTEINRLQILKSEFMNNKYELQTKAERALPSQIATCKELIAQLNTDIANRLPKNDGEDFRMTIRGKNFDKKESAGDYIIALSKSKEFLNEKTLDLGEYRGFKLRLKWESSFIKENPRSIEVIGKTTHSVETSISGIGNITKIDNLIDNLDSYVARTKTNLSKYEKDLETIKEQLNEKFVYEDELEEKLKRKAELDKELNMDARSSDIIEEETENTSETEYSLNSNTCYEDYGEDEDLEL